MKNYLTILLILSAIPYASCIAGRELSSKFNSVNSSDLGVKATNPALEPLMEKFLEPSVSKTGKSLLTANKMGFDVLDNAKSKSNWLLDEFYSFLHKKTDFVLDVGCGYGNLTIAALSKGHTVIANDIAVEHLIEVRRRAIAKKLEIINLYLNNKYFPNKLKLPNESLGAVMLHRVLHFLSPSEIEDGLARIHKWLKRDGKLFIVVMVPQHVSFSGWFYLFIIMNGKRVTNGQA